MAQLSILLIYRHKPLIGLGELKGGVIMRIPDDQNVHKVKCTNRWAIKTSRVKKAHKDEFEEELADRIDERKSKAKTKIKKDIIKVHQALVDESQELEEEKPINSDHFSIWA
jgi:hypothetical protein